MTETRSGGRYRDVRVARLAEELLRYCDRVDRALRGRGREVNYHLRRAAASAVANVGEALDEESRGDKRRLFRYAYRSCGECERCLRGLAAVGALPPALADEGERRIKDVKLDLLRLIAWTKKRP